MPKIVDKEKMRHHILDAAMRVFAEKGYHAASVNSVAEAAGLAKGTLYIYFESKDEMTTAIVDRYLEDVMEQIAGVTLCETLDAFLEELKQTMDVPAEQVSFHRMFFEVFGPSFASDEFTDHVAQFFDKLGSYYAKQISHLQKMGEVSEQYSASSLGRVLASMLDGVVLHKGLFGISERRHRHMIKDAVTVFGKGLQPSAP